MNDAEDLLRRTFRRRESSAPSPDQLLEDVRAELGKGRASVRWLVPIAASAVTTLLIIGVVTQGFGMLDSQPAGAPAVSSSSAPTPDPSTAAAAAKCADPPGLGHRTFSVDQTQEITVTDGRRLLLKGIDDFCQRTVMFDGQRSSPLLSAERPFTGADWLRATAAGVVTVSAVQPMCVTVTDPQCFGGLAQLGSIEVTIVPREPPTPVIGRCSANQISLRAEAAAGTASEMLWVTVRLDGSRACLLSGAADVEVFDREGASVLMPNNPLSRQIGEPLRPGHPVVITWDWLDWFCGRADPYSARLGVLGQTDRVEEMNTPSCPTEYGDPPRDPRGLRFHSVMVLR